MKLIFVYSSSLYVLYVLLAGTRDLDNCLFWKFLRELNSRNSTSVRESGTTTTIHNSYNNLREHSESIALKQMPPSAFRTDHKKMLYTCFELIINDETKV